MQQAERAGLIKNNSKIRWNSYKPNKNNHVYIFWTCFDI